MRVFRSHLALVLLLVMSVRPVLATTNSCEGEFEPRMTIPDYLSLMPPSRESAMTIFKNFFGYQGSEISMTFSLKGTNIFQSFFKGRADPMVNHPDIPRKTLKIQIEPDNLAADEVKFSSSARNTMEIFRNDSLHFNSVNNINETESKSLPLMLKEIQKKETENLTWNFEVLGPFYKIRDDRISIKHFGGELTIELLSPSHDGYTIETKIMRFRKNAAGEIAYVNISTYNSPLEDQTYIRNEENYSVTKIEIKNKDLEKL